MKNQDLIRFIYMRKLPWIARSYGKDERRLQAKNVSGMIYGGRNKKITLEEVYTRCSGGVKSVE